MNKWSRNSIYGAGLASLLYLGCGNSVQNKDIKVQENTDLSLADKNLDDFYQPTDSSLEDRINPIDSRELDYISIEDSSLEIQRESDILPDSLEYDNNLDQSLNDLSRDDYFIDLGSDHVNRDSGLDDYVSSDLDYCNSLEINSLEWCENCNIPPIMVRAWFQDEETNPNHEYEQGEAFTICNEVSNPSGKEDLTCKINTDTNFFRPCNSCNNVYDGRIGPQTIYVITYDSCTQNYPDYSSIHLEVNIIPQE